MQFTRINDITIHYHVIGAVADKPVLVFINSLGTDFRIWRDVVVRLADDFAIVLYDKRGHGLSDIGQVPYSIEDHATDLAGLLDRLAVKRTFVCGLSVGGLIAQSLYQRRPDLVRALVLSDTAHKIGTAEMWDARIAAIEAGGIEAVADGVLERWFTPAFRRPENLAFAGYRNMLVRQPTPGYVGTCAAIRDADYTEAARKIAVPVLCVVGDQDGSTPPDLVRSTARLIPGARLEVIRDAGHIPCVEQPEAMTRALRSFFDYVMQGDPPNE
ncbi:3-oxoadipate enol-lactonase [Sinorhizobium saheli]|uniref:3-oxoadipate enol-lactonase n=1 Tax=Sinorhizobium saheli TaxID=36856 RepID=A0A178YQL4_SINSA|nr:3-oxoadipate enol-lactonase [Sinorhizobium saheli]MQW89427.1 3-oxoadipate enol-lactonase [Sinorhizobium saheli]OAP49153.1 3-oxoadipate enol-lactonase [Sinorhizobium saheli]